jgi:HAD superfamily hydrolase (TIGR01549 family)
VGVGSHTVRCYKPESRIVEKACHLLSVEPPECVMVGDTPGTDISGAQAAVTLHPTLPTHDPAARLGAL